MFISSSYSDYDLLMAENLRVTPNEEFVPYLRSDVVLSPTHAAEPSPMSREATMQAQAREAYYKSMQPAQYGKRMHNIKDQAPIPETHAKVGI